MNIISLVFSPAAPKPSLYYDGDCPVCAREVAMYRRQAGGEGVRWVDAARCTPAELGPGLTRAAALSRLHLRQPDGTLLSGAAAFTGLWRRLPRWAWLGRLFGSAAGSRLLAAGYRVFLAVRPWWRGGGGSR